MNNFYEETAFLTDKQLEREMLRCEYCEKKPCKDACPVNCSAADFIMAAKKGEEWDFKRSAAVIMKDNPLGGICGMVCPDRHCMAACSSKLFDGSINIPAVQAAIVEKAKQLGGIPEFEKPALNNKKIAVIGSGPAGIGAAASLAQKGYSITIFEKESFAGGMCNLIPKHRLDRNVLKTDLEFVYQLGDITVKLNTKIENPEELLSQGFESVIVGAGLWKPIFPGIPNEDTAIDAISFLKEPGKFALNGNVAVIGGGATATDCAMAAKLNGAPKVEMIALEKVGEMPLTKLELDELIKTGIEITGRTSVTSILKNEKGIEGLETVKVTLPAGSKFNLKDISEIPGSKQIRKDIDIVIMAIGNRSDIKKVENNKIFYTGDCINGPTTVVEAVAAGKNTALIVDSVISKKSKPAIDKNVKNRSSLPGYVKLPVSLETDFFGRKIISPFILSAAPPSDGLEQMRKAYEAGWAGGIMKTAFDNVPIHIPAGYMHAFNDITYGNCDNVSGHALERVCSEIKTLIKEYPDRLTMGSTGGPVTGNDEGDKKGWQSNTKKLEEAGAMGIEYSLSCPQGGDGTEGDIVSQNAALTAKIIDWVMEISDPEIPKLFKLTAAVTSIVPIANAIKEVFDKYPDKKAGVTLANTFPTVDFREIEKKEWFEGIVFGMSGKGVAPISFLTLTNVSSVGLEVSGNGGVMDYMDAAHFLALGVNTVQVCTIAMKYGYGIINELEQGLSNLMAKRNIKSVSELRGIALPSPIRDFMDLTPVKKISDFNHDLCVQCGNCTRCPYLAISPNEDGYPQTDPERCIGCSICSQKCFTGAIYMRDRTEEEVKALKED